MFLVRPHNRIVSVAPRVTSKYYIKHKKLARVEAFNLILSVMTKKIIFYDFDYRMILESAGIIDSAKKEASKSGSSKKQKK